MNEYETIITGAMFEALDRAEKLIEEGWANDNDQPRIYKQGEEGSSRPVDAMVWVMMRAISTGIGIKSKWDRESRA